MTTCSSCAAQILASDIFCPECGTPVGVRTCPSCGVPADRGRFCAKCGTALDGADTGQAATHVPDRPVAERRVTSVLFGDLVGFTPLSESRDAEDVRELLSRYFEECRTVIGRYGGTVEKFIGDAVMAVWGVPVAHEDDAERSVRAGLELVQTIVALGEDVGAPGLAMRVGVVTGEVAVTVGATAEGMVAGDAVNTASRVQSVAEPGRVWVDDATRALTSAAISYQDAGEHTLKGKAEPLRLWRASAVVAAVGGLQRVDGLEAPLSGQAAELRLIKDLFHATEDARRPRLVVLDGEAGVGKSRLAWEFEKYSDGLQSSVRWHRGRCLSYGKGVAFWALAEAIRGRLALVETDSGPLVTQRLEAALEEFVPDEDERQWIWPRLAALIGPGTVGAFVREDLFAAWTTFLERVGGGREPVVLVLDDAQYADDGLLDFVDHLLAKATSAVFVLALARPELLTRRHDLGGRRATVIRLEPLDDAAMAGLLDGLVHGLSAATRAELVRRAEGIPLFAVETVRSLIDRDLVVPFEGRYVPATGGDLDLTAIGAPASLQSLVAARLDALTSSERRLVADASVLGLSFSRDALDVLVGDLPDRDSALASLVRKEILGLQTDRFSAERGQYRFVQSVVRQVAYGTLAKRDRKVRHLAVAEHLSAQPDADGLAVVVAQHYLDAIDASPSGDPDLPDLVRTATGLLERAAERAAALGSPAEALHLLEAALERAEGTLDRARLQEAAAEAALDVGQYDHAIERARAATTAWDELGDPVASGRSAALQGAALLMGSADYAGVVELLAPHWQRLEQEEGAESALLPLATILARTHDYLSEWQVAQTYLERQIRLAEAVDDPAQLAEALFRSASLYSGTGAPATAAMLYQNAAGLAREHHLTRQLARTLTNLATVQVSRDLPAAVATAAEALQAARTTGARNIVEFAAGNLAIALWTAGRWPELRALDEEMSDFLIDPQILATKVAIEWWMWDAVGGSEPGPPEVPGLDTRHENAQAWRAHLQLLGARHAGSLMAAVDAGEASIRHAFAWSGVEDDFMLLWPGAVVAAIDASVFDRAEQLLQPVAEASRGLVTPALAAQLARLRGLLGAARGDSPEQVEADLRAGIAALDSFGAVPDRARTEESLGHWLIAQGRAEDAEPVLAGARATYEQLGAAGWLRQLDRVTGQT